MLLEIERIAMRGGMLGAVEAGYQRGKIQAESLHYDIHKRMRQAVIDSQIGRQPPNTLRR